jgi:hypothetical protein
VQRVKKQLQGRQPLLPIDDGSLLHLTGCLLNLLQYDSPKEMRVMSLEWLVEDPISDANDVAP